MTSKRSKKKSSADGSPLDTSVSPKPAESASTLGPEIFPPPPAGSTSLPKPEPAAAKPVAPAVPVPAPDHPVQFSASSPASAVIPAMEPEKSTTGTGVEAGSANRPAPASSAAETKIVPARSLVAPPPPAPLVSLGAALEAIKFEIPTAKPEPPPTRPAVTPPIVTPPIVTPVKAVSPVKEVKPAEKSQPAAPIVVKTPATAGVEMKKTAPTAAAPGPTPDKKISEAQIVKKLPVLKEPEPKVESAPPPTAPPRPVKPMFVVMITPELAPVAKVGGLGDVTFGLARELELRGNAVEIILPKYDCMRYHHIWGLTKAYEHLQVPWFGGVIDTTVWFGFVHGRKCYFIDPHSQDKFFNRGAYYGQPDDLMRFAFFCRAAMEFLFKTGKQPDIIHCHDWQTALVPVLLWEMYQHLGMRHPRVCFTIHNFKHQGLASEHLLRATGLNRPEHFFNYERLRDNQNPQVLNLMKGGIVYSNFVTTVSPRHAWEAKDGGQAFGLEPTLHTHHLKYGGVLNGLDYDMFNPEKDPHIPSHYNAKTIEKKYENKRALRQRLWLTDNEKPIVAFIGRLDPQKGPELVRHAIFYALNHGAQFVLLGESPDKAINDHFWALKRHLNNSPDCHLEIGYSDELAHLIYAGADMMVVPSRFEPCGLTQLISLRYGTVPIVRSVGGLADTVFDKDHSHRPLHERNGYVFHDATDAGLESALERALGCYYQFPEHFRHLMENGMNGDYSWNHPGQHYLNIYDYIREK